MKLTPFSYVVLTLVGRGGATAPELSAMRERGRLYWTAPRSQWYAEPKKLADAGYLKAAEEPGRTGPRTRYTLTAKGRRAVAEWLRTPVGLPRIQNEAVVRVMAADLADDPADLRATLTSLREDLAAAREQLAAGEAAASELGERAPRLRLQHRMAQRMVDAMAEWADDIEELLETGDLQAEPGEPERST